MAIRIGGCCLGNFNAWLGLWRSRGVGDWGIHLLAGSGDGMATDGIREPWVLIISWKLAGENHNWELANCVASALMAEISHQGCSGMMVQMDGYS